MCLSPVVACIKYHRARPRNALPHCLSQNWPAIWRYFHAALRDVLDCHLVDQPRNCTSHGFRGRWLVCLGQRADVAWLAMIWPRCDHVDILYCILSSHDVDALAVGMCRNPRGVSPTMDAATVSLGRMVQVTRPARVSKIPAFI